MKNQIFTNRHTLLLILFLQYGNSNGESDKAKEQKMDSLKSLNSIVAGYNDELEISARHHFIENRNSYLDATNSFGGQEGRHAFGAANIHTYVGSSYQNSHPTPIQSYGQNYNNYKGYGAHQSGYEDADDNSGSSKTDIIGLVGLLGLKGLKGTLPLVKLAALALIALSPVLVPLTLIKFLIILLKPVITFGRSLTHENCNSNCNYEQNLTKDSGSYFYKTIETRELFTRGIDIGNKLLGRELGNQCMERIACEGLLKSIPRIFMRIVGENYPYKVLRKRRNVSDNDGATSKTARRKDLAKLALSKLKTPQFYKRPPINEEQEETQPCAQYKCTVLF